MGEQVQFTSEGKVLFNNGQVVFNCECCDQPLCYCSERKTSIDVEFDADFYAGVCERCPEYGTTLFEVPFDVETTQELQDAHVDTCWYQLDDTGICLMPADGEDTPPYEGPPTYLIVYFSFNLFGVDLHVILYFPPNVSWRGTKHWDSIEEFEADGGCEGMHEGDLALNISGLPNDYCPIAGVDPVVPKWRINPP